MAGSWVGTPPPISRRRRETATNAGLSCASPPVSRVIVLNGTDGMNASAERVGRTAITTIDLRVPEQRRRALGLLANRRLDELIALLGARIQAEPKDAEAHSLLGFAYAQKSNALEALHHL